MPWEPDKYTYHERLKYLNGQRKALRKFNERYPDLSFSRIHPKDVTLTLLKDIVKNYEERLIAEKAYLEPEEQDTIVIGSVHKTTLNAQYERQQKMVDKAKETFTKDLEHLIKVGETSITAQILGLQGLSAAFTGKRIDKRMFLEGKLKKHYGHYADHHINKARRFSVLQGIDLQFIQLASTAPEESGTYILFDEGEIFYIGHSGNLKQRLSNHELVRKYYLQDEDGQYIIDCVYCTVPLDAAKELERRLIEVAKPKYNNRGK